MCNYALAILLENRDENGRDEFLRELDEPVGPSPETVAAIEELTQAREAGRGTS